MVDDQGEVFTLPSGSQGTFLLVRHGETDAVGNHLAGRSPICLNNNGFRQSEQIAQALASVRLARVLSSPITRARQTAEPTARIHQVVVEEAAAWRELAFGTWEGERFSDLEKLSSWRDFNAARASYRPPGGENLSDVTARTLAHLGRLAAECTCAAIFTHADVIRATLLSLAGRSLNEVHSLTVPPGSISVVRIGPGGYEVLGVGEAPDRFTVPIESQSSGRDRV